MNILGLSIGEHCSASLIIDGKVKGASYEERFHRKKLYGGFPYKTAEYLLTSNGITKEQVDLVAVVNEMTSGLEFSVIQRLTSFSVSDYVREAHEYYKPILLEGKKRKKLEVFKDKIDKNVFPPSIQKKIIQEGETLANTQNIRKDLIYDFLGRKNVKIEFVNHHDAHALYGFLSAPKDCGNSLIFTADSFGDGCNSNVYKTSSGKLECIYSSDKQNLGRLFRNITLLMGMKPYQHEYKVMGLAPYASNEYSEKVKKILSKYMCGFNGDWVFNEKPKDNYFTFQKEFEGIRFDNIAGGLQSYFEDRILEWFEWFLKKEKDFDCVIFSGGLAMNVKVNLKLDNLAKKYNKRFFVAPSADDHSHSIASAFFPLMNKNLEFTKNTQPGAVDNLSLGYSFEKKDDSKIESWAKKNKWKIINFSKENAAKLLKEKKILGLCHGAAEFGARALGFRSIIADPSDFKTVRRINIAIKNRDFWMPFAPSILEGKENDYIKIREIATHRFMAAAADTTKKGGISIEAAVHPYDQTARPQIVSKDFNLHFYNIIEAFGKLTGTYALLNTSLNLHGYPIVNNAEDLIFVLENSELDGCILKNSIILR